MPAASLQPARSPHPFGNGYSDRLEIHAHRHDLLKPTAPLSDEARLAIAAFLARYSGAPE